MTLDEYLSREKKRRAEAGEPAMTDADFGVKVKLSQSQISRLRAGLSRPSWEATEAIMAATGGEVTPNDWVQREAAQ